MYIILCILLQESASVTVDARNNSSSRNMSPIPKQDIIRYHNNMILSADKHRPQSDHKLQHRT